MLGLTSDFMHTCNVLLLPFDWKYWLNVFCDTKLHKILPAGKYQVKLIDDQIPVFASITVNIIHIYQAYGGNIRTELSRQCVHSKNDCIDLTICIIARVKQHNYVAKKNCSNRFVCKDYRHGRHLGARLPSFHIIIKTWFFQACICRLVFGSKVSALQCRVLHPSCCTNRIGWKKRM